jgi:hypothetical protein
MKAKALSLAILSTLVLTACYRQRELPLEPYGTKRLGYYFPARQGPPDAVYNRLKEVRPPDPPNPSNLPEEAGPRNNPVIHLDLKKVKLCEAAKLFASAGRYSVFCADSISDQKVTINELGTLDELAGSFERQAGINVVVDHQARQIRFFPWNSDSTGSGEVIPNQGTINEGTGGESTGPTAAERLSSPPRSQ